MFSLQRTLSLGYLGQHPLRAILVVIIIALGVAIMVATRTLNHSLTKAARGAVTPLTDVADLLVVNGQAGVPRSLAAKLNHSGIAGLHDAQPLVVGRVMVPELDNRSVLVIGVDWYGESGAALAGRGGLLARENPWGVKVHKTASALEIGKLVLFHYKLAFVGPELAQDLARAHPATPNRFKVALAGEQRTIGVVGTVSLEGDAALIGNNVIFMEVKDAAALIYPQRPDYVSQINVRLAHGSDPRAPIPPGELEAARQRVQDVVGDRAEVRTQEANDQSIQDLTAGLELGFSLVGAAALVVGLFLVYIVLSVTVAERRHDIGILRSVGATRSQIAGLFLGEATLLGLAGSALGVPLGKGLALLALGPVRRVLSDVLVPLESAGIEIPVRLLVLALGAGTATAILAALVPAVAASLEEPADAVRRVPVHAPLMFRILHIASCLLLVGAGLACVIWRDRLPPRGGTFGAVICFLLAFLVATPLLVVPLGLLLQPIFRNVLGLQGRLAADNLLRSPGRTGLVIAVLGATGALMVQTAGFIRSSEEAVYSWIEDNIAADLFVTAGSGIGGNAGLALPMSDKVGQRLRAMPEVESALAVHFQRVDINGRIILMLAIDTQSFHSTESHRAMARNLGRFPRLVEPHTALVSENFAAQHNVKVGQRITVPGRNGPLELEVIGTVVDYTWSRGTIIVDRAWFAREFGDDQVDIYDLYLRPGADPEVVRRQIQERWGKKEGLFVATRTELHNEVSRQLRRVYNLAYAQQSVIGLVAMLGVLCALLISVLQRRRELGLLRAVGASRGQVLGSVLAEATLMALIGALLGFGAGLVLEYYVVHIVLLDEAGFVFPMKVAWGASGIILGLSVLVATVLGLWPAYQATRLRIPEAIAYE